MILLDKDHILPSIQPPTDEDYWIKKPSEPEFLACANEFWWCLNNVAKGLWREEIPYVHAIYTEGSHAQLLKMLNWKSDMKMDFVCPPESIEISERLSARGFVGKIFENIYHG